MSLSEDVKLIMKIKEDPIAMAQWVIKEIWEPYADLHSILKKINNNADYDNWPLEHKHPLSQLRQVYEKLNAVLFL